MGSVFDKDLTRPQTLVLLALADHADHDGRKVFPSVAYTAWKTAYSHRQVQRVMRQLQNIGVLVVVREAVGHHATEYRIELSAAKEKPPYDETKDPYDEDAGVSPETGRQNDAPVTIETPLGRQNQDTPGVSQSRHPNRHSTVIKPSGGEPEENEEFKDIEPQVLRLARAMSANDREVRQNLIRGGYLDDE